MTDLEKQELAEQIADALIERVQQEVGRSILKKLWWGMIVTGLGIAFAKGWLKP